MFKSLLFLTLIGVPVALATPFLDQSNFLFQQSPSGFLASSGCSAAGTPSCQNNTEVSNLCCFESPGGLLLQTQFWDTHPTTGPHDSWTIHGLWPDNCDTTFNENCDPSRNYRDIGSLLADNGARDTLNFMKKFWVNINGDSEELWEHEWATHGTCLSTLNPSCLPSDSPRGAEAVAYFQTVVNLFQSLPTYTFLLNAGIEPSTRDQHTLDDFISALENGSGFTPAIHCSGKTVNQISWYFNLQGSVIDGNFIPINSPQSSTCPRGLLHYPPKS